MTNWTFQDYYLCFIGICVVRKLVEDAINFRRLKNS